MPKQQNDTAARPRWNRLWRQRPTPRGSISPNKMNRAAPYLFLAPSLAGLCVFVLVPFALFFTAFALAMFGVYELQLPTFLRERLDTLAGRTQGGSLLGAAVLGVLSSLLVSPCVSAPLAGALLYISTSGDALDPGKLPTDNSRSARHRRQKGEVRGGEFYSHYCLRSGARPLRACRYDWTSSSGRDCP